MLNRFHPVYHGYTCLTGSRVDIERTLEEDIDIEDPEDVIDLFSEPPQYFERLSPVSATLGDKTVKGRNWTDMTIKCYRQFGKIVMRSSAFLKQSLENEHNEMTMIPFMSLSVDPDTLARLIEFDYESGETSYTKLIELFETGALAPALTTPFQAILPLLRSSFDRRLCIRLGLQFFAPILRAYQRFLNKIQENRMAVSFWVPEAMLNTEVIQILHEEFFAFCAKEKFKEPHLVLLLDATIARGQSLDKLMKSWCQLKVAGKILPDLTVMFRDPAFSDWMMHSHPSIKKIIDRTIAKVDGNLSEQEIDYTWSHFEGIEALTLTPRDTVHFEQRILKLCELGYLSLSPDTFARRKLNGRFGVGKNEPLTMTLHNLLPEKDHLGEGNVYGGLLGWALDAENQPHVMPSKPFLRKLRRGSEKRQGSPCWKIAWEKTRRDCTELLAGNSKKMAGGMLGVLASLTGSKSEAIIAKNVESFLLEYGLIYWREHFIQHDMSEADIRLDEIVERTLRKGSKKKLSLQQIVTAGCAVQAYFFLLESANFYALKAENLDQRAMFQNTLMLTLALCNGVAVYRYLGQSDSAEELVEFIESHLVDFGSAYERYDFAEYGVSKQAWNKALRSEIQESKANLIERVARRTAARHLGAFGYEDRFGQDAEEITTNVGHYWSAEVHTQNYKWANPHFCGVREA